MKLLSPKEQLLTIPGGIGINLSIDPEILDPTRKLAYLNNLDMRYPGLWTKRIPRIQQTFTGSALASALYGFFFFEKNDGTYYDLFIDTSASYNRLLTRKYTGSTPGANVIVDADMFTQLLYVNHVRFRDILFMFNGTDAFKYFSGDTSGSYTENVDFGNAGVYEPTLKPFGYATNYGNMFAYSQYNEDEIPFLGGYGCGMVQYKYLYEFDDGELYGNVGPSGYHPHQYYSTLTSTIPFCEFQWIGRYKFDNIYGYYETAAADNALVTARILCSRHKTFADQPFSAYERLDIRNTNALNVSNYGGTNYPDWLDAQVRSGVAVDTDNDSPPRFKYAVTVGGDEGVIVWGNQVVSRTIPYPVPRKQLTEDWGTPTRRRKITIQNNSGRTFTRPTVRVVLASTDFNVGATRATGWTTDGYGDLVFTALDGRTVWDCVLDSHTLTTEGSIAFIVTPPELVAGETLSGYVYYSDPAGLTTYASGTRVYHPYYVNSDEVFNSWCTDYYWPPNTTVTANNDYIRNRATWLGSESKSDGVFQGTLGHVLWIGGQGARSYGLVTSTTFGTRPMAQLQNPDYINIMRDDDNDYNDAIGHVLENMTFELWFKKPSAFTIAPDAYYVIWSYTESPGGDDAWIVVYLHNADLKIQIGETGGGLTQTIIVAGVGTAVDNDDWCYLGISIDSGKNINTCFVAVDEDNAITDWGDFITDTDTLTYWPYELSGGFSLGCNNVLDTYEAFHNTLAMYLNECVITERAKSIAEMKERARDRTFHDNTTETDQPSLTVTLDSEETLTGTTESNSNLIGWTKQGIEVFPTVYQHACPSEVNGLLEWQDDAIVFGQNWISRLVTNGTPDQWQTLENIAQEAGDIGCVADKCLFKTDTAMIFMSSKGLYAWNGSGSPNCISDDLNGRWLDSAYFGQAMMRNAVGFYWPKWDQIFVSIPDVGSSTATKCYVMDWSEYRRSGKTEWTEYSFGLRTPLLKNGSIDADDMWFSSVANARVFKRATGTASQTPSQFYKDWVNGAVVVIDWDIHTSEIPFDEVEVTAIDLKMDQKIEAGTDESNKTVSVNLYREESSFKDFGSRTLSKTQPLRVPPKIADSAQVRLSPDGATDTDQDPICETRIKRIEIAYKG